jgi:hypothetical protein
MFMNKTITAILSAAELTLGSFLHSLRIPMTGQLMSMNQCFWLNVSKSGSPESSALSISLQVAGVKMMAPMGKRLTPMLAIAAQGLLFESGTFLLGPGLLGRMAGSCLMGTWSLLQPLILYSLFLGFSLNEVVQFFSDRLGINIYWGLSLLLMLKMGVAAGVCLLATFLSKPVIERYGSWIQNLERRLTPSSRKKWKKVLFSPFFLSLILINLYFYYTSDSIEFFIRQSLFYFCWMIAAFYFMDLVGGKLAAQIRDLHLTGKEEIIKE